jgi:hypothetical protein
MFAWLLFYIYARNKRKYNDTNGAAAENDIWCPRALQVVIQDGTGDGAQRDQLID